ncbi:MAG TPA: hypothetical protein VKE49_12775 [Myxococcaceae bacterium]|nr:hypothetical protein [Myxococcaceae bacterium]
MKRRLGAALFALYACSSSPPILGEQIGKFTFKATKQVFDQCNFVGTNFGDAGVDGGPLFTFEAILSHDTMSEKAVMLLGSVQRDGGFDGQYFVSQQAALRQFAECGLSCDKTTVDETIRLALFSRTQKDAVGGSCPPNPLDGGVPSPDGGVLPPHAIPGGFDAVLACGEMEDTVIPDGGSCGCVPCTTLFQVEGVPTGTSQ